MESVKKRELDYRLIVVWVLVILLVGIFLGREILGSQVMGRDYRYNLVLVGKQGEVEFVSFDPTEKKILAINYPKGLSIESRSVGSYQVGQLYQLGSYEDEPGEFVRKKVQGFMRVPIRGYLVWDGGEGASLNQLRKVIGSVILEGKENGSLSRVDGILLRARINEYEWKEVGVGEMMREGVIEESQEGKYEYQEGRLQQFLSLRIVGWVVGKDRVTMAIVNESGKNGLGSDMASLFGNMGFDVVAVRTGEKEEIEARTKIIIGIEDEKQYGEIKRVIGDWLGKVEIEQGNTQEWRAKVLVEVGEDAEQLF